MTAAKPPCLVCGQTQWIALPDPAPRSMTSDWRVVDERLAHVLCGTCGLVRRNPTASTGTSFFASGYALYAHAPGDAREQTRQAEYARWIAQATGRRPRRVLDVGCGNGSLLRALRTYWPDAQLHGCDPSAEAVASGAGEGLHLWAGTANDLPRDLGADLVIAVNVLEHTTDPIAFLAALRTALHPDGLLVIVCPDGGGRPGVELLFVDHLFSFGREHLAALFARAGLQCRGVTAAPGTLGAFQMALGRAREATATRKVSAPSRLEDLTRYLDRWRQLDDRLQTRLTGSAVCFGAGEAAGLLRAYAPRAWSQVRACTIDPPAKGTFGELPIVPLDEVKDDETVLVGVRPTDQARVAERLTARFQRVVTWYDFVDDQPHA
jgi:SAM-dependent methyltransferase